MNWFRTMDHNTQNWNSTPNEQMVLHSRKHIMYQQTTFWHKVWSPHAVSTSERRQLKGICTDLGKSYSLVCSMFSRNSACPQHISPSGLKAITLSFRSWTISNSRKQPKKGNYYPTKSCTTLKNTNIPFIYHLRYIFSFLTEFEGYLDDFQELTTDISTCYAQDGNVKPNNTQGAIAESLLAKKVHSRFISLHCALNSFPSLIPRFLTVI